MRQHVHKALHGLRFVTALLCALYVAAQPYAPARQNTCPIPPCPPHPHDVCRLPPACLATLLVPSPGLQARYS